MTEEYETLHPTEILADEISKFIRDIEALKTTFSLLMHVMYDFRKEPQKKYSEYIEHIWRKKRN